MKINKNRISAIIATLVVASSIMSFEIMNDTGQAGKTGSPGETACNGCHTGNSLNDGVGSVVISSPDLFNWEYMTGDTYNIDVTVTRQGAPLFGFGMECLTNVSVPQNAGLFLVTNSTQTQILSATVNTVSRKSMTHKLNSGLSSNSKTFSFKWIAPTTNVGNVTFYCAGNAANNNGLKTGDFIYTTSQVITPALGAGAIEEALEQLAFSFFPNPTSGNIFVNYTTPVGEQVNFTLTTLEGKVVGPQYTFRGTGSSATSSLELPTDLARGIYFLKMENGNKVNVKKVIVE